MCRGWLWLLVLVAVSVRQGSSDGCTVNLTTPRIVLSGVLFAIDVHLPAFINHTSPIAHTINYTVTEHGALVDGGRGQVDVWGNETRLQFVIPKLKVNGARYHHLNVTFVSADMAYGMDAAICQPQKLRLLAIPALLTLIPPIVAAVVAILFRQVLLALVIGIWLCALFAYEYNPGTAILRALDTYFVDSMASGSHSAIIVSTFFLGGLIGVVQKSGGGVGLAKLLCRFAGSRRRASALCMVLCFLIFFDDYSCVLIAGTSLRTVMDAVGVSKDKFAFIVQNIAPVLPSVIPISSWIGVEIGYVESSFATCPGHTADDAFVTVIKTIPYRFFPLLVMFTVMVVVLIGRDFGPMVTAERNSHPPLQLSESAHSSSDMELSPPNGNADSGMQEFAGPLAPKPGKPYRWFNAAIPFLVTVLVTLVGMVVSGWNSAKDRGERITVWTIFSHSHAIAALIWAAALGSVVLCVMLLVQRILFLKEFMEAWIEGVKEILEPIIILLLAWGLGAAIEDIQTSSFIAQVLEDGNVSPKYLPALVTLLGFFISFATGSAFGTMGILFPLVIPTLCKLSVSEDTLIQSSGAILGSAILGNVISPMADITILTTAATQCPMSSHLKTSFIYIVLVGCISVVFGSLPVGAGWYPWYVGWAVTDLAIILLFLLLSSSPSITSRSLCKRIFPCLYSVPDALWARAKGRLGALFERCWRREGRSYYEDFATGSASDSEVMEDEVGGATDRSPLLPRRRVAHIQGTYDSMQDGTDSK